MHMVHVQWCSVHINISIIQEPSWSWSSGSWIYNYLCNQCLSPLTVWVRTTLRQGILNTTLYDKVCQWLATGWWFSPGTPVSSTNKTDSHDITQILLKVALNTINQTLLHTSYGVNSPIPGVSKSLWDQLFLTSFNPLKNGSTVHVLRKDKSFGV